MKLSHDSKMLGICFFACLFFLFVTAGCSVHRPDIQTNIQELKQVQPVNMEEKKQSAKPAPVWSDSYVTLDLAETRKLFTLVQDQKQGAADFNWLLSHDKKLVKERNDLLVIAQDEERRANRLAVENADVKNQLEKEIVGSWFERVGWVSLLIIAIAL